MLILGLTGSIATGKSSVGHILSSSSFSSSSSSSSNKLALIDADVLARNAIEPGTTAYDRIVEYFGENDSSPSSSSSSSSSSLFLPPTETSQEDSQAKARPRRLNRAALGRRVFGTDPSRQRDRQVLNSIVHPAVRWEMYKSLAHYYVRGHRAVVLDVPLLFETGFDLICGVVIVVAIKDVEVQVRRLVDRGRAGVGDGGGGGGMSEEEAWDRVRSQWDVRDKVLRCEMRNRGVWEGQDGRQTTTERGRRRGIVIWNDGDRDELKQKVDDMLSELRRTRPPWWSWACLLLPPLALVVAVWHLAWNLRAKWAWDRQHKTKRGE